MEEKRNKPEEEARTPGRRREPVSEQASDESVPDPSGDVETTEEDRDNPLVNDGSSAEYDDQGGHNR